MSKTDFHAQFHPIAWLKQISHCAHPLVQDFSNVLQCKLSHLTLAIWTAITLDLAIGCICGNSMQNVSTCSDSACKYEQRHGLKADAKDLLTHPRLVMDFGNGRTRWFVAMRANELKQACGPESSFLIGMRVFICKNRKCWQMRPPCLSLPPKLCDWAGPGLTVFEVLGLLCLWKKASFVRGAFHAGRARELSELNRWSWMMCALHGHVECFCQIQYLDSLSPRIEALISPFLQTEESPARHYNQILPQLLRTWSLHSNLLRTAITGCPQLAYVETAKCINMFRFSLQIWATAWTEGWRQGPSHITLGW